MKEIRISVPVESRKSISQLLERTPFRERRELMGVLDTPVGVLKLGNASWYKYQRLTVPMDFVPDNIYMRTGDFYQELKTGTCIRVNEKKHKFLEKTPIGYKNYDVRKMTDSDRLVLASVQGRLNDVMGDHNTQLNTPMVEFNKVVANAHYLLTKFPFHSSSEFTVEDNTAAAVFNAARETNGRKLGFKTAYWIDEVKKITPEQAKWNFEQGASKVMASQTLDESFKEEFLGLQKRKYVTREEADDICQVVESALMNSGLKLRHEYQDKLVGIVGCESKGLSGKCIGYTTERQQNGAAKYVLWVKTDGNSCLMLTSGAPYPKEMVIDAFNNKTDLEFTGTILNQTQAVSYGVLSSVLSKLNRPAITEIAVSPACISPKLKDSLVEKQKYSTKMVMR